MAATWTRQRIEGFDHALAADFAKGFNSLTGGSVAAIATANTRHNYGQGISNYSVIFDALGPAQTWLFAGAIKRGASDTDFSILEDGTDTYQVGVRLRSDGFIEIRRGSGSASATLPNVLATSGSSLVPGSTWVFVGILYYIHNSAGIVHVFISDLTTPALSVTSADTQATGNTTANRHMTRLLDLDDYHCFAGSGSPVTGDMIPDSRIVTEYCDEQGDLSDFTPNSGTNHVDRVRDAPTTYADGDSTYLQSNSAGDKETMLTDDLPVDVDTINGVQVTAFCRKNDAASRACRLFTRRGGTNYFDAFDYGSGAGVQSILDTYRFLHFFQALDPVTSAAWLKDDVDDTQIGYELNT